jgi:hypothetical protein
MDSSRLSHSSSFARYRAILFPLAAVFTLAAASTHSFPNLLVDHGEPCKHCHINPNGGGPRTEYGNYSVAFNELCLPQTKKLVATHFKKPRLGESVLIGFDTRHLVLDHNGGIFRMQTDAFVTVEPIQHMYYNFRINATGAAENYALLTFKDVKYFVKAGHFYPAFGWHIADHTAYVRSRIGFVPPFVYWDGLSLGAEIKGFNVTGEIIIPNQQRVYTLHVYKAGSMGNLGYGGGFSVRYGEKRLGTYQGFPPAKALFGGLSYGPITGLGEVDLVGTTSDTLITYAQLVARVQYGLYLMTEYSFFQGDRRATGAVDEFVKFAIQLYPLPFVQLQPTYTWYTRGTREYPYNFELMVHFGY